MTTLMTDQTPQRHPARRSRIAAMGIGVAAMAGLVGNMEVAGSKAHAATSTPSPMPPAPGAKAEMAYRHKVAQERLAAVRMPIVLTPHTVVHSVAAPAAPAYGRRWLVGRLFVRRRPARGGTRRQFRWQPSVS